MVGKFHFNEKSLKLILLNYYKGVYGEVKIFFTDPTYSKSKTGIKLERCFKLNDKESVTICEELEKEDIKQAINGTFESEGYIAEEVTINTHNGGSGWGEYTAFNSIDVILKKEKVKVKTL